MSALARSGLLVSEVSFNIFLKHSPPSTLSSFWLSSVKLLQKPLRKSSQLRLSLQKIAFRQGFYFTILALSKYSTSDPDLPSRAWSHEVECLLVYFHHCDDLNYLFPSRVWTHRSNIQVELLIWNFFHIAYTRLKIEIIYTGFFSNRDQNFLGLAEQWFQHFTCHLLAYAIYCQGVLRCVQADNCVQSLSQMLSDHLD